MKVSIHAKVGVYGLSFEVMLLFTIKKPADVTMPVDYHHEKN